VHVCSYVFVSLSACICVCAAVYHCKCIDTWLVQDSDLCPLCKKSVIDDDMEEEAATASQSATAPTTSVNNAPGDDESEDAPLLRGASRHRRQRYGSRLPGTSSSLYLLECVYFFCF